VKELTELEKHILAVAKPIMDEKRERYRAMKTNSRYITSVINIDGIWDTLVFDKEIGDFTEIQYRHTKGDVTTLEGESVFVGYSKEIEIKRIILIEK
jgi:hypothetical protein